MENGERPATKVAMDPFQPHVRALVRLVHCKCTDEGILWRVGIYSEGQLGIVETIMDLQFSISLPF